ncbi:MAG: PAS domain S-box protein [Bacteroidales bacterium]|nr:PAS domain S-box protein [Bacteroidales bacterium]
MKRGLAYIAAIVISSATISASAQTDSIAEQYKSLTDQYSEYINTEPFVALEFAAQAKQMAEQWGDSASIASAYKNIGFGYYKTRVYYLAIEAQFKAYEIYSKLAQNDKMALCQIDIARTYYAQEAYDLAEEYCSKAIDICRQFKYPNIQATALTLLGDITIKNDEDDALKNLIAARNLYEDLNAEDRILETNIKIAQAYAIINEQDSALDILDECLEKYQMKKDLFGIANTMETYAYVYITDDNATKAAESLKSAYESYHKAGRPHESLVARTRLASLQIDYNMDDQARSNAEAVLHDAEMEEMNTGISELRIKNKACDILRIFYKRHGMFEKALHYSDRYAQTSDSIFEQKKKEQFSEFQVSLESQKQQKEIEAIQYQAERDKFNLERKQNSRNIIFLIVVILLVIIVVLIYYFRYKEKNNHNKQLSESNNRMQIEIQERKLAEAELRNSEEKYRLLFRKTPIGIIQFNDNFKITTANERIAQIFNLKNKNVVGQDITSVVPQEVLRGFDVSSDSSTQSDKISKQEYEINTDSGKVYASITLKPYHYSTGREVEKGGIMIVEDITDRKIAEQNASQLSQKQTSILNILPDTIFNIDQNGTFTYAKIPGNSEAEKQFVGRNMRDKFDADILLQFLVAYNEAQNNEDPQYVEYQKDGKYYEARFAQSSNNTVLLTIRDIPAIRNIGGNGNGDINTASKAKSELLLNMTQNTKQPIENIIVTAENLAANATLPENSVKATGILKDAVSVHETLTEIWNLARIESGKNLYTRIADPRRIADDIYNLFKQNAEEKNLEYTLEVAPDTPKMLIADGVKLRQILFNLVSNAIKFTDNGSVKLNIDCKDTSDTHTTLVLTVADTGVGISKQVADTMFIAGENVNRSSGTELTARLVENLKGTITVDSTPGLGSTFTVTIKDISIYNTDSEEAKDIIDIASTTKAKKKNASQHEFIEMLKAKIIPEYRQLKKNISFDSLLKFAEEFRTTAQQHQMDKAASMATSIIHSIKNFDINAITISMRKVESYIIELVKPQE